MIARAAPEAASEVGARPLSDRTVQVLVRAGLGLALGLSLGFIGFGDYGELSRMFTLRDIRLYLTFGGAVAVTAVGLRFFARERLATRPMHRSIWIGGSLFGIGWALAGACPGIALVQIGEGSLAAFVTLAGMLVGFRFYDWINVRWLRWGISSCSG